ncbi:RXT2-like protein [Whalleya microplaca]|nr:RXT2-like protein [Whalleya microplaca]
MASQQVLFAETITAMKKALKRKSYESDSDTEIDHHGNRGHKLKRRARFVHEGQLAPPSGPEVYREVVNHAGYRRAIISRNPILLDDEGFELDSDDDEEHIQDVADSAAEFNPYANVRLENILAPLTSVTDLPTHPTLSRPYTSKTLGELTKQGCNIMQKENAALWKVKHLQTKLVGDHIWAPCDLMLGPNDLELYRDDCINHNSQAKGSVKSDASVPLLEKAQAGDRRNGLTAPNGEASTGIHKHPNSDSTGPDNADTPMVDVEEPVDRDTAATRRVTQSEKTSDGIPRPDAESSDQGNASNYPEDKNPNTHPPQNTASNASSGTRVTQAAAAANAPVTNGATASAGHEEASNGVVTNDLAKREAEHESSRPMSVASESIDDFSIHPLFLPPRAAHPDRDMGIPEPEAEDVRRLLQLFVQKQEEVCRGVKRLYEGLLRADRMRKTVLQWSKYEAHVGPNNDMSDGEDWYDKEEWGLEEDLKKGQDEEEEDTTQTTKKTRTRR